MSKERRGAEPDKEREQPYCQAARFMQEGRARRVYFAAQDTIFAAECELSSYRFLLQDRWHIAVVGEPPPEELAQQLRRVLRAGIPASLPEDVLTALHERGKQMRKQALWTERHYRPDKDI
jgi:hypothetical protein